MILPLGDSLTRGKYEVASYRYDLWQHYRDAGLLVDFIGSLEGAGGSGSEGSFYDPAEYPGTWDQDHEGHGGATWGDVTSGAPNWFSEYSRSPDIVLLMLGTNDARAGEDPQSITHAERLITTVGSTFPAAAIALGLPPPLSDPEAEARLRDLRTDLTVLAEDHELDVVDMTVGFDMASHLHEDGVHLTHAGDSFVAERWLTEGPL